MSAIHYLFCYSVAKQESLSHNQRVLEQPYPMNRKCSSHIGGLIICEHIHSGEESSPSSSLLTIKDESSKLLSTVHLTKKENRYEGVGIETETNNLFIVQHDDANTYIYVCESQAPVGQIYHTLLMWSHLNRAMSILISKHIITQRFLSDYQIRSNK